MPLFLNYFQLSITNISTQLIIACVINSISISSSMGNISNLSQEHLDDPHSLPELKIVLDLNRPVHTEVRQLLHWSLE